MASDSLLKVIAGLVKREARQQKEDAKKAKEAVKAKAEQDDEEDEDEDPVGDPKAPAVEQEEDPEAEGEPEGEEEPEEEPEPEDDGAGDSKPNGPDPVLVQQVADIVVAQLADMMKKQQDAEKAAKYDSGETKLSGKKEKIDTKPKLEQVRKGKMNFREAMRMSITGTHLKEGYEEAVLDILEDEKIDGPLGYEPFFEKGKLFVEKGSEKKAAKVLKQSKDINKVPKIVGETTEFTEYADLEELQQKYEILATTEAVEVDGRKRGFKQALKRLTYEKLQALKKEGAAEFMAAASAAKREGKKKFKFGGKEYPVTIKVDIPLKGDK
jgi:hypothetical protein|tara:strand:- start:1197 stop:2171 length:975 start_codon:yes stop_codon:yes gene_type:complete